jgi:hypothetical protein
MMAPSLPVLTGIFLTHTYREASSVFVSVSHEVFSVPSVQQQDEKEVVSATQYRHCDSSARM